MGKISLYDYDVLMPMSLSFANVRHRDEHAEFFYELERSKEFFPKAWEESERLRKEIEKSGLGKL